MVIDLFFLTALLHWSGGLENPLFLVYLFHPTLALLLLPARENRWITVLTAFLITGMGVGELTGGISHHHLYLWAEAHASQSAVYVLSVLGAFLTVLVGNAVFHATFLKERDRAIRQLIQAEKLAGVGELAAAIAHQISNPIGIIAAKVKLLLAQEGALSEKVQHDLRKIDRHAERIAALVKGLLAFSRPSTGRRAVLDLNHLIRETIPLFEDRVAVQGVSLETVLSAAPLHVQGNSTELQQALLNLVNNALDALKGGGKLTLSSRRQDGHGESFAVVSVRDTGAGISSEMLEQIFQPFVSSKPEGQGTGLGLPIARRIVQSHGGTLEVASEKWKGSVFTIRLPLEAARGEPHPAGRAVTQGAVTA